MKCGEVEIREEGGLHICPVCGVVKVIRTFSGYKRTPSGYIYIHNDPKAAN